MRQVEQLLCGFCDNPLLDHWQCQVCRCLAHPPLICKADPAICTDCATMLAKRGKRRCKDCAIVKPMAQIKHVRGKPIYRCLTCQAIKRRAYYVEHAEHERARAREWDRRNPEAKRERSRAYYYANHSRIRAGYRERYWQNRDAEIQRIRRARIKYAAAIRSAKRTYQRANRARARLYEARHRARRLLAILRGGSSNAD